MLAQLKTVVLIKEAMKLAFFRLVEYVEHQHVGSITGSKWPETKTNSCSEKRKVIPGEKLPRN
jgi:hypothetical protein